MTTDHISNIKDFTANSAGYSHREEKLLTQLATSLNPEDQKLLKNFITTQAKTLPIDYYDIYEQKGILDQLELAFIEAQTELSKESDRKQFFESILSASEAKIDSKTIDKILDGMKNEEELSKILIALGPSGIQDLEAEMIQLFIDKEIQISLKELLETLHELIRIKNLLTKENIVFMEDIIELYTNVLNQLAEERKSVLQRADQIVNDFLKKRTT